MLVNEEQLLKASSPIEVTEYSFPEIVTVDGIVTSVGSPEYPETSHSAGVSLVTVNSKSSMMTLCAFNPNPEISNAIISKIFFIIFYFKIKSTDNGQQITVFVQLVIEVLYFISKFLMTDTNIRQKVNETTRQRCFFNS